MMEIVIKPIGVVRVDVDDDIVRSSLDGVSGRIEIFEEYSDGLEGIDGFSNIIVLAYLHKVSEEQRRVLKVKHKRLIRLGFSIDELPEVGVFCTDSPHRPVPIALTIVKLLGRKENILYVENLDLYDGTPVLDIKPYTSDRVIKDLKFPEWYSRLMKKVEEKLGRETNL
ncbi:MAG: tRNA (N6-threonylcarbamoyladenosine(37)-N6)-methyltransferase TrmO [Nitrososphaerota archaeon]|nr:tRNA (N6-threonylcarbamoyladenosine(37)-N6)-methyltransferase TrmO [Nitrososphaerota archaeon]